mmetsp:Transcript_39206/g.57657  ORF Transcript_39206/g.57657 Transcript_39206/m.57657 type:complete len:492 (+) Transcript_39206:17-1492(+)
MTGKKNDADAVAVAVESFQEFNELEVDLRWKYAIVAKDSMKRWTKNTEDEAKNEEKPACLSREAEHDELERADIGQSIMGDEKQISPDHPNPALNVDGTSSREDQDNCQFERLKLERDELIHNLEEMTDVMDQIDAHIMSLRNVTNRDDILKLSKNFQHGLKSELETGNLGLIYERPSASLKLESCVGSSQVLSDDIENEMEMLRTERSELNYRIDEMTDAVIKKDKHVMEVMNQTRDVATSLNSHEEKARLENITRTAKERQQDQQHENWAKSLFRSVRNLKKNEDVTMQHHGSKRQQQPLISAINGRCGTRQSKLGLAKIWSSGRFTTKSSRSMFMPDPKLQQEQSDVAKPLRSPTHEKMGTRRSKLAASKMWSSERKSSSSTTGTNRGRPGLKRFASWKCSESGSRDRCDSTDESKGIGRVFIDDIMSSQSDALSSFSCHNAELYDDEQQHICSSVGDCAEQSSPPAPILEVCEKDATKVRSKTPPAA